ncbi:MAG: hypothetical protein KDB61_04390, partial [Planctomycetes bacterium]|nr:hypothetical protein [Planctomycetota bacterium]
LVFPHDHAGPVYRHVVMASFGGGELPTPGDVLAAPELPRATQAQLFDFAKDWMAVDREQQVWKPEFERLKGIIGDLEKDLAEHKLALETAGADLMGHKQTLEAVRTQLRATAESAARSEHELRQEVQAHAAQSEHLKRTLEEQARGSQAALQDMRSHYEAAMAEAGRAGEAVQVQLGSELERTRQHAQALEAEREGLRQHAQALESEREGLRQHAQALEAEREALQQHASDLEAERERAQSDIAGFSRQVDSLGNEVRDLAFGLSEAEAKLAHAHAALSSWRHALGRVFGRKYRD